jgi:hypothetical protein
MVGVGAAPFTVTVITDVEIHPAVLVLCTEYDVVLDGSTEILEETVPPGLQVNEELEPVTPRVTLDVVVVQI